MAQSQQRVLNDSEVGPMIAAKALNDKVFRPQKTLLDDSEVSRLIAAKALDDSVFRQQLLGHGKDRSNFRAILQVIPTFREQIANQAKLRVPNPPSPYGNPQDLSTYLRKKTNSRVLLSRARTPEGNGDKATSVEEKSEWGWVGNAESIARLAVAFLNSTLRFQADPSPFPFERLPPELRLMVYREAFNGTSRSKGQPVQFVEVTPDRHKKKGFPFRIEVYLPKGEAKGINVGLLTANRLVISEATAVLYQLRTFDFRTNVGAIASFLRRLSDHARQNIHGIGMEYHCGQEPDYCCGHRIRKIWGKGSGNQAAWSKACLYIVNNVKVKGLNLAINVKVPPEFKSLEWVKDLVKIKGLKFLTLEAYQHENSGPWVIRASYKEGRLEATDPCFSEHLVPLFEYLREEMLE